MKNYFRNQQPQCVPNQEDKENAGYENFDNANVAASLLMLFHCSAKESRLQELYEFTESAPTSCLQLSSTLAEFDFGCKFNNNRRIRFYHQVITFAINTTTTTCNIEANIANPKPTTPISIYQ
jgi:hypothetical protein